MQLIETAKKYLLWNTRNLVGSANLQKSEIKNFFAESFLVRANGSHYDANTDNYFDFLNQFRSTIHTITYDVYDYIADNDSVVMPLTAHIARINGHSEDFEAILILKFNNQGKIILWYEVYIKI